MKNRIALRANYAGHQNRRIFGGYWGGFRRILTLYISQRNDEALGLSLGRSALPTALRSPGNTVLRCFPLNSPLE